MYDELGSLLRPDTIAVLGASRDPRKWGQRVIRYTRAVGFEGEIFAVNPNARPGDIPHATVIPSLEDAPSKVSCAFLAVPRDLVLPEVERCCSVGVSSIVIAASGFGESSADGAELENRVLELTRSAGARVVGPNCFGVFSAASGINLTPFEYPPPGRVALVSQSGNIAAELFLAAAKAAIGFSHCVGVGNQADVTFGDLLAEFARDPDCEAVAMYVEGLPADGGDRFVAGLGRCRDAGKPVVVIKAGASKIAAAVAQTHTRSLAADDRVWEAVLSQFGAIRVSSVSEMIDVLRCAIHLPTIGRRVAIITDGGGDSVLATDSLSRTTLMHARLSADTVSALEAIIPAAAPRSEGMNPLTLDTAGGVEDDPQILSRCVEVVARDADVDTILVSGLFGTYTDARSEELLAAETLRSIAVERAVSLVFHAPLPAAESEPLALLADSGVPFFDSIDRALRAIERLAVDTDGRCRLTASPEQSPASSTGTADRPRQWRVDHSVALLTSFGVGMPPVRVVSEPDALSAAAADIGYPVCLKTADPRIVHKSDAGGVVVNLGTPGDLQRAAARMWATGPGQPLLVMPSLPEGFEMLVGGFRDPYFGPVVIVGRGGVLAEMEADTALVTGGITKDSTLAALRRLRCYPVLAGYRGRPPLAIDSLCQLAVDLGAALAENPNISVDLNPVRLYSDRCAVADVRVLSPHPDI